MLDMDIGIVRELLIALHMLGTIRIIVHLVVDMGTVNGGMTDSG